MANKTPIRSGAGADKQKVYATGASWANPEVGNVSVRYYDNGKHYIKNSDGEVFDVATDNVGLKLTNTNFQDTGSELGTIQAGQGVIPGGANINDYYTISPLGAGTVTIDGVPVDITATNTEVVYTEIGWVGATV